MQPGVMPTCYTRGVLSYRPSMCLSGASTCISAGCVPRGRYAWAFHRTGGCRDAASCPLCLTLPALRRRAEPFYHLPILWRIAVCYSCGGTRAFGYMAAAARIRPVFAGGMRT